MPSNTEAIRHWSSLGAQSSANPKTGATEVRYWIRDNGRGLTPESQSRLFVEFERLGQTGKSVTVWACP